MGRPALGLVLLGVLALLGCGGPPTLADAERQLSDGQARQALRTARAALPFAEPEERPQLRRVGFDAGLEAGWSHEAAREYLELRDLAGQDEPTLLAELAETTLLLGLGSPDVSRQLWTVAALGQGGSLEAARLLQTAAESPELEPAVRAAIPLAAGRLTASPAHRQRARRIVAQAGQDPDPVVRRAARWALLESLRRGGPSAADERVGLAAELARAGCADPDLEVQRLSLELLAELARKDQARAGSLLETAARQLRHGDDRIVVAAAQALAAGPPGEALARLTAVGLRGPLQSLRRALELRVEEAEPAVFVSWLEELREAPYEQRLAGLRGLRGQGVPPELASTLLSYVRQDPARAVRKAALDAVADLPGLERERVGERLAAVVEGHPDPGTRRHALRLVLANSFRDRAQRLVLAARDPALAEIALSHSLTPAWPREWKESELGRLLTIPGARLAALRLAGSHGLTAPRERLLELLGHHDLRLQGLAVSLLGRCALPSDAPGLVELVADPTDGSDVAAAVALAELSRRSGQQTVAELVPGPTSPE